jgi:hypothetical protein
MGSSYMAARTYQTAQKECPQMTTADEQTADELLRNNPKQRGPVDPALVAAAKTGNLTARGRLFMALHGDRLDTPMQNATTLQEFEAVLKDGGNGGNQDDGEAEKKPKGTNPFGREGWNVTRQGQIAKSDFALAERLAKAAGVHVGATKPARTA